MISTIDIPTTEINQTFIEVVEIEDNKKKGRRSIKFYVYPEITEIMMNFVFAENEHDAINKAHKFLEIPLEENIIVEKDNSFLDGHMIKGVKPKFGLN